MPSTRPKAEDRRKLWMERSDRMGREGKTKKTRMHIRDNKQTRSGEILAGGTAKCTPKRHERYRGPRRAGQPRGRGTVVPEIPE